MKIIITEQQLIKLKENNEFFSHMNDKHPSLLLINQVKSSLFKYWDKKGPDTSNIVLKLFGIDELSEDLIIRLLIEWYGGYQEVYKLLEQYENKVYRAELGTYDFKFRVSNFRTSGDFNVDVIETFWFDAEVDGNGIVDIDHGDGVIIDNVYDAHVNENFGWEVDEEMKEAINLKMFLEVTKKTGLPVQCDFMSVTEKGMFKE